MQEVTRILSAIQNGDAAAGRELLPLVYEELRKLAAQERERMATQREPERAVIGDDVLAFGRHRQLRIGVVERRTGKNRRQLFDTRHFPHRVVTMTGERRERAGRSEGSEVTAIELRAVREIASSDPIGGASRPSP